MRVRELYNDWAASYDLDQNATRDLDRTVLARLLRGRRFNSVIDLGCGTGKNTPLLSRLGRRVRAVDFSPAMLAKAKQRPVRNVEWLLADITRRWPFPSRSADLVTCNLILEHLPRLGPVFAEAARVLKPGGRFLISELHPFRQYAGVVAKFRRAGKTRRIPAFVHHISDFLRAAEAAGFLAPALQEWWHKKDKGKPPRLITFVFRRAPGRTRRSKES